MLGWELSFQRRQALIHHRCLKPHQTTLTLHVCSSSLSRGSRALQRRLFRTRCTDEQIASTVAQAASDTSEKPRDGGSKGNDRKQPRKPSAASTVVAQRAPAACAGPLPEVLAATFPDTFPTLSAARRVIRKDLVLVCGAVGSCKSEVCAGQELTQLEEVKKHKGPRTVSLEVAYEDDSVAVVHKPWGVKMYGGDGRRTITGALRAGALKPSPNPDALPEPKPVHRLDAAVGGLLVVAKTASAVAALSAEFEGRRVHKVYHALLSGRLEPAAAAAALQQLQLQSEALSSASDEDETLDEEQGDDVSAHDVTSGQQQQQLELSMPQLLQLQLQGRPAFTTTAADISDATLEEAAETLETAAASNSSSSGGGDGSSFEGLEDLLGPGVQVVDLALHGKPCYTLYQVLGYSRCARFGGWMTTAALSPVTGRKHQLRQHMAALGHPIVGDGKYTNNKEDHISNQGIYLESLEVSFTHPVTQKLLHITILEPQRFATLREQQHKRWRKMEAAAAAASNIDQAMQGAAEAEFRDAASQEAAAAATAAARDDDPKATAAA